MRRRQAVYSIPVRAVPGAPAAVTALSGMQVTSFEWYYTLFALIVILSMPFVVGDQPQGADSLNPVDMLNTVSTGGDQNKQVILLGLYSGFTVLLLSRERLRAVLFLGYPLISLLAWTAASTAWSIDPSVTLRRSVALAETVVLGVYLGLRYDLRQLQRLICATAVVVLTASLILGVIAPPLGLDFEGRLRGVTSHKNEIASFAALALLASVGQWRDCRGSSSALPTKLLIRLMVPLSLICIALAHSTGIVPVLAAAIMCLVFGQVVCRASSAIITMLPLGISVLILAVSFAVSNSGAIAELLGKDSDISGRTLVWAYAEKMIQAKPVLGYGLGAFWTGGNSPGAVFWAITHLGVPHAHNGYLQLMLDVGIVGMALFLLAIGVLLCRLMWLIRTYKQPTDVWALGFLGLYLMTNFAETWLWIGNEILPVLFVAATVRSNLTVRLLACSAHAAKTRAARRGRELLPVHRTPELRRAADMLSTEGRPAATAPRPPGEFPGA